MSGNSSNIALLSIRPKYVHAILSGRKMVEFRKRRFARPVSAVVIYATSPIKKIVAYFKVSKISEGKPEDLWRKYSSVGGIESEAYWSYFRNAKVAVAIGIKELKTLDEPLNLICLTGTSIPPQSYSYLPKEKMKIIQNFNS